MLRLALYFNHYNTLGHSTRVFSFVKGVKEYFRKNVKIIIFQGGKRQYIFPWSRYARIFLLPYSIDKRGLFIEENARIYKKLISKGKMENMFRERFLLVKKALKEFRPDFFITEYFPLGREFWTFEVPYILREIKDNFNCRILASAGYLSWIEETYNYIKEFYDFLFIHSPREFTEGYNLYLHKKGAAILHRVFMDFPEKVCFTGFIMDGNDEHRKNFGEGEIKRIKSRYNALILVSRGGGIVNKKIILSSILAAKRNKNLFFIITCGPATSGKEFRKYCKLSRGIGNIRLFKVLYPSEFNLYMKEADLSINMAGYNTSVKLLYYRKKTILVPYYTSEQRWRAELIRKYLPSRIIPESSLSVGLLESSIKELLGQKNIYPNINKNWFSGISNTIKLLKCMI